MARLIDGGGRLPAKPDRRRPPGVPASPPTAGHPLSSGAALAPEAPLCRADAVMAPLIDDGGALPAKPDRRSRPDGPYGVLLRAIAGQQLSVKAAASIWQ